MIFDLVKADGDIEEITGICIVGAGIAGLILGTRLRACGVPVTILESGGDSRNSANEPLNRVVSLGRAYLGATEGRARCLGGTSTLWGGALIPFLPSDLEARSHLGLEAWPVQYTDILPFLTETEALFGLDKTPYENDGKGGSGFPGQMPVSDPEFLARFAKWPRFRLRNVATLLKHQIDSDAGLKVYLNATATSFHCGSNGRLERIRGMAPSGRSIKVSAQQFVLCAGAIESTRLLLLLDRQNQGCVRERTESLGRYFHDHVSLPAAELKTHDPDALNRMAAFFFKGATMRSLRFEMSPDAQLDCGSASGFGHIAFETESPSGFDVLRGVMKELQSKDIVSGSFAAALVGEFPYLARAGFWRLVHQQLYWPKPARYLLHVVAEQLPRQENRIALSDQADQYGCPIASIDWRIGEQEAKTIGAFARRFDDYWARQKLDRLATLNWSAGLPGKVDIPEASLSDIYHPGGTTRMATKIQDGVVNKDLQCFAVPNLSVAATSVFPSGASSNPTMMLIAFSLRLADHLGRQWKKDNTDQQVGAMT